MKLTLAGASIAGPSLAASCAASCVSPAVNGVVPRGTPTGNNTRAGSKTSIGGASMATAFMQNSPMTPNVAQSPLVLANAGMRASPFGGSQNVQMSPLGSFGAGGEMTFGNANSTLGGTNSTLGGGGQNGLSNSSNGTNLVSGNLNLTSSASKSGASGAGLNTSRSLNLQENCTNVPDGSKPSGSPMSIGRKLSNSLQSPMSLGGQSAPQTATRSPSRSPSKFNQNTPTLGNTTMTGGAFTPQTNSKFVPKDCSSLSLLYGLIKSFWAQFEFAF